MSSHITATSNLPTSVTDTPVVDNRNDTVDILMQTEDHYPEANPSQSTPTAAAGQPVAVEEQELPTSTTSSLDETNANLFHKDSETDSFIIPSETLKQSPAPEADPGQNRNNLKINKIDAITYLEQVKKTFVDHPNVYNTFLEIMKDFKAHTISTYEVVHRVNSLFRGYGDLIEGFNAFLPHDHKYGPNPMKSPGYPAATPVAHINNVASSQGLQPVPVNRFPSSATRMPYPGNHPATSSNLNNKRFPMQSMTLPGHVSTVPTPTLNYSSGFPGMNMSSGGVPMSTTTPPGNPIPIHSNLPLPTSNLSAYPNASPGTSQHFPTPVPTSTQMNSTTNASISQPETSAPFAKRPSMGMGQAVNYLRKIQQRFCQRPDIYTNFVEILRSYQKNERDLKDVKAHVASLFAGHADLLDEFGQFIPEQGDTSIQPIKRETPSNFEVQTVTSRPVSRKTAQQMVQDTLRSNRTGAKRAAAVFGLSPTSDFSKKTKVVGDRSSIELEFFEKVKAHLNFNEQLYGEFLKCLNWYTLDILKKKELVKLVQGFIGRSEELFSWFKTFIGYTETDQEPKQEKAETVQVDAYSVDLLSCKRLGSYRFLPKNYDHPVCSGRSLLCLEVLNDDLVSCPSFASEDSTFVSSKKNQYEEALFRCEDERYELDLLIDGNQTTMATFEPLLKKLSLMSPKEAERFTLGDTLGGVSEVIYRNIIRKVYGKKADQVIDALKKQTAIALPVVLRRLKQKDEEWRMAQRDWNRVWREIHFKNYYKALDHQGISFKTTDKKLLSAKNLINEIQVAFQETRRRERNNSFEETQKLAASLPSCQGLDSLKYVLLEERQRLSYDTPPVFAFGMADIKVFEHLLRLLLYQLNKSNQFSGHEKKSIEKFLLHFLPLVFPSFEIRKVEKRALKKPTGADETSGLDEDDEEFQTFNKLDIEPVEFDVVAVNSGVRNSLLANENLYVFFRLLQVAFHRLYEMKTKVTSFSDSALFRHKKNYLSVYLDLKANLAGSNETDTDFFMLLIEMLKGLIEGTIDQTNFEERVRLIFGGSGYIMFTFDRLLFSILKQCSSILSDAASEHLIALYDTFKSSKEKYTENQSSLGLEQYQVAAQALVLRDDLTHVELFSITISLVGKANTGDADLKVVDKLQEEAGKEIINGKIIHADMNTDRKGVKDYNSHFAILSFGLLSLERSAALSKFDMDSLTTPKPWQIPYIEQFIAFHSLADPRCTQTHPPLFLSRYLKDMNHEKQLSSITCQFQLKCQVCSRYNHLSFVKDTEDCIVNPMATFSNDGNKFYEDKMDDAANSELIAIKESSDNWSNKESAEKSKFINKKKMLPKCVSRFHAWLDRFHSEQSLQSSLKSNGDDLHSRILDQKDTNGFHHSDGVHNVELNAGSEEMDLEDNYQNLKINDNKDILMNDEKVFIKEEKLTDFERTSRL